MAAPIIHTHISPQAAAAFTGFPVLVLLMSLLIGDSPFLVFNYDIAVQGGAAFVWSAAGQKTLEIPPLFSVPLNRFRIHYIPQTFSYSETDDTFPYTRQLAISATTSATAMTAL